MSAAFCRVVSICGRLGFFGLLVFFLFFLELKTELRASISVHARPQFMRLSPTLSGLFMVLFLHRLQFSKRTLSVDFRTVNSNPRGRSHSSEVEHLPSPGSSLNIRHQTLFENNSLPNVH